MNALLTVRRVHHVDIFLFSYFLILFVFRSIFHQKKEQHHRCIDHQRENWKFCGLFCFVCFFPRWIIGSWINRPRKKGTKKKKMAAVVYFSTVLKTTTALTSHSCTDWRDFWRTENGPFTHRISIESNPNDDDLTLAYEWKRDGINKFAKFVFFFFFKCDTLVIKWLSTVFCFRSRPLGDSCRLSSQPNTVPYTEFIYRRVKLYFVHWTFCSLTSHLYYCCLSGSSRSLFGSLHVPSCSLCCWWRCGADGGA